MKIFEDIIATKIEHVLTVNYKVREKTYMSTRPWYGIAFSLNGELTYTHNSKKIPLHGNQIVFIPKNSTYEVDCMKAGAFAVINFLTANELDICDFISTDTKDIHNFQREFESMQKNFLSDSAQNKYKNMSSLYKIFSMLINSYDNKRLPSALNSALQYIDNNIHCSDLNNTQISKSIGISEVYLRKLFSNNMAINVKQYVQNKRIETAMIFLTETSMPITEISEKCGFSCIYYFCNSFKRKTGYTPTQYRNNTARSFF